MSAAQREAWQSVEAQRGAGKETADFAPAAAAAAAAAAADAVSSSVADAVGCRECIVAAADGPPMMRRHVGGG